jgi:hypothetical protein
MLRVSEHGDEFGRRWPLFVQPAIQDLLHRVGDFAEFEQADHAPAAFQRMEAAPDCLHCFAVLRRACATLQVLAHGRQRRPPSGRSRQFEVELGFADAQQTHRPADD